MRILITGGAGFLGSHIVDKLIARGDKVLVIDNYVTGRRDNLIEHSNLQVVEGTIANRNLVKECFKSFIPEIVIHAAASYKDPNNWEEDSRTNVTGTANIVQEALNTNIKRLIYFQTALCYGTKPIEQPITLNHPLRPYESSYAISKTAGENYISLSGLEFISFRLANAYGPRNLSGPLPTFYHRLINNKKCFVMKTRRDFIFVDDLVDVVMLAIDGIGSKGYYHISSGSDYSIKELFDAAVKALNINLDEPVEEKEMGADDTFTILLDPSKTNRDFGWKVKTHLEYGIRKAIEWYCENGINQTYTHLKVAEGN